MTYTDATRAELTARLERAFPDAVKHDILCDKRTDPPTFDVRFTDPLIGGVVKTTVQDSNPSDGIVRAVQSLRVIRRTQRMTFFDNRINVLQQMLAEMKAQRDNVSGG